MILKENEWYKSNFLGVFKVITIKYNPVYDEHDLIYETYSGEKKMCSLTSEFIECSDFTNLIGPATLDDLMVEEL